MSSEALAALRRTQGEDFAKLAEQHIQHDLTPQDRDRLNQAASRFSTYTLIGSLTGLALGGFLAIRLRQNKAQIYQAFKKSASKPTHVRFADGREEALPDLTPALRPSLLGDLVTYLFFAGGGVLFGGELGFVTGAASARRGIAADPESRGRIEEAFRRFRVDVLKREIQVLEKGDKSPFDTTSLGGNSL